MSLPLRTPNPGRSATGGRALPIGMASMEFGAGRESGCATSRVGQWVTSPAIRLPLPKRKNAPPYIRAGRLWIGNGDVEGN
jgi:hypothetical protein